MLDVVVVGSGPNGLAAAVALTQGGASVLVVEMRDTMGGGTRTEELTLPGFRHDVCSAAHPMGILSPFFRSLPLEDYGLQWCKPPVSVAHPLLDAPAVLLKPSLEETAAELGADGEAWVKLFRPFVRRGHDLLADALAPLGMPKHPLLLGRFGLSAIRSAAGLARSRFREERARALFAGCAAHALLPLEHAVTAAIGLMFGITGHIEPWPVARGGSRAISDALAGLLKSYGGRIETGISVRGLADLPESRIVLFDTDPRQVARIAGDALPVGYRRRLERFRFGPGVFKLDWALEGSIPWADPNIRSASTVHIGGPLEEVARSEAAMWRGDIADTPFILLVQQSEHDPSRAPPGYHTGYAYCHVPAGSDQDLTDVLEARIERFAPGFRSRIRARHAMTAQDFERYNPNWVGGAITGGVADIFQLFTRPVAAINPYRTPNPRLLMCSASTPPGGGVHGMCGFHAAQTTLRLLARHSLSRAERPLLPKPSETAASDSPTDS